MGTATLATFKFLLVLLITVSPHGLLSLLIYYVDEAKRSFLGFYVVLLTLICFTIQNRGLVGF